MNEKRFENLQAELTRAGFRIVAKEPSSAAIDSLARELMFLDGRHLGPRSRPNKRAIDAAYTIYRRVVYAGGIALVTEITR